MYTQKLALKEFPFYGTFYIQTTITNSNGSLLEDSSDNTDYYDDETITDNTEETIILQTECDIQQNSSAFTSGTINRTYKVYFPFDLDRGLPEGLEPGIFFRCNTYGLTIAGTVKSPVASQHGKCIAEITGTDV